MDSIYTGWNYAVNRLIGEMFGVKGAGLSTFRW
jgi:hypothetical protein